MPVSRKLDQGACRKIACAQWLEKEVNERGCSKEKARTPRPTVNIDGPEHGCGMYRIVQRGSSNLQRGFAQASTRDFTPEQCQHLLNIIPAWER